jgi:hypothetical protein
MDSNVDPPKLAPERRLGARYPRPSLSPALAGCPTRGLRAVWLVWGWLPDEAAVNAVSERAAASGWIAPH